MHDDDEGALRDLNDRRDVGDRIIGQLVEIRIHRIAAPDEAQCVTVRARLYSELHSQHAARAGSIVDHELLAEALR